MTEQEAAYLAGSFDAAGCVRTRADREVVRLQFHHGRVIERQPEVQATLAAMQPHLKIKADRVAAALRYFAVKRWASPGSPARTAAYREIMETAARR